MGLVFVVSGALVILVCGINCGLLIRFWYDDVLIRGVRFAFGRLAVCWCFAVGCVF